MTCVVGDGHEDIEPADEHRVDMEEVARRQVPGLCGEELRPRRDPDLSGDGSTPWRFKIT